MRVTIEIRRPVLGRPVAIVLALVLLAAPAIALASHQFSDVPSSHLFHYDVDAIRDAGVTGGCGGGKFCPGAFVTRGQMAAFLNRLGALAPDKEPVVNADRLDGHHANGLVRVAQGSTSTASSNLSTSEISYGSVTISVPADGFVLVTATPTVSGASCTSGCQFFHRIRHVQTDALSLSAWQSAGAAPTIVGSAAMTWVFPVTAGEHTFESRLHRQNGTGTLNALRNALTAMYTPFGSTGGSTP